MEYNGYQAEVRYDDSKRVLRGSVKGMPEDLSFEAKSVTELEEAFKRSVNQYNESHGNSGKVTGKLNLQLPSDLLRKVAAAAELGDSDINTWLVKHLQDHFDGLKLEQSSEKEEDNAPQADAKSRHASAKDESENENEKEKPKSGGEQAVKKIKEKASSLNDSAREIFGGGK